MSEIKACPTCGEPRYQNGKGAHVETGKMECPKPWQQARPLFTIAREIELKWANPYFGAVPYISAMKELNLITDRVNGQEHGDEIVLRFLVNAKGWRGEDAKRIKAELRAMLP